MSIFENKFIKSCKNILKSLLIFCFLVCMFYYFAGEIQHIFVTPYIIASEVSSGFLDENKILLKGAIYSGLISALSCVAVVLLAKEGWIKILSYLMLFTSCVFLLFPLYSFMRNKSPDRLRERASLIYSQNVLAFRTYLHETKQLPSSLEDVISALPEIRSERNDIAMERLNCRLTEPFSGKTNIVQIFDGTGGWVYNPEQGIFGLNVMGMEQYTTNFSEYLEKVKTDSPAK
ncbi:MAG: hypothetical protein PHQ11_13780 [Paludibacter sp.]|nr:hypothetical protein [Paludibacter sp.]MDD4429143.1 hypothetical protein [Paludibacter sp.]